MKRLLIIFASLVCLSLVGLSNARAQAAFNLFGQACSTSGNKGSVCQDANAHPNQDAAGNNSIYGKDGLLSKAITILDIVIGLVAVIMIVVGGLKYVLSGGDSNSANSARDTVLYAVIGLVIAVTGQVIVKFVLNRL